MIVTTVTIASHPHSSPYILLVYCVLGASTISSVSLPSLYNIILKCARASINLRISPYSAFTITQSLSSSRFFYQSHGPLAYYFLVPGLYNGRSPYLTFIILVNWFPGPHAYVPQLGSIHRNLSSSHWKLHKAPRQKVLTKSRPLQFIHSFIHSFHWTSSSPSFSTIRLLTPTSPLHSLYTSQPSTPHQEYNNQQSNSKAKVDRTTSSHRRLSTSLIVRASGGLWIMVARRWFGFDSTLWKEDTPTQ